MGLVLLVGTRFQGLFHSAPAVLFTFPSRYWFTIGRQAYLALEGGPPGFPRDSSCPVVLGIRQAAPHLSPTGLLPSVAGLSRPVRLGSRASHSSASRNPSPGYPADWFRLLPVRSPLLRESRLISFPRPTEMFQFGRCPPHSLWIQLWVTGHYASRVAPFGDPRIYACLRLPEAYRSLPRPSSAPGAKASAVCPFQLDFASDASRAVSTVQFSRYDLRTRSSAVYDPTGPSQPTSPECRKSEVTAQKAVLSNPQNQTVQIGRLASRQLASTRFRRLRIDLGVFPFPGKQSP